MAQTPYITTDTLKARLTLPSIPIPTLDTDLGRIIRTASKMVKDRCVVFDELDPPDEVQQVTLMLSLRMRTAEIQNYQQPDGSTPTNVPLWTQDLTDILGVLILDTTPESAMGLLPATGVMTKVAPIASPRGVPDANAEGYAGSPNPRWATWRVMP